MTEIIAGVCDVGAGTDGTGVDVWVDGDAPGGSTGGGGVDCNETAEGRCVGSSPPKTVDKPESVHDLESFRPKQPKQFSEPYGWSLLGLHTNFVSRAKPHVVIGELVGHSAEVRFIPVRFRRSFGDGHSQSTSHKGSRWTSAWAHTLTDHTYWSTGVVTVRLVVDYVADYRFSGLDWVRLDGIVSRSAPPLELRIFDATTVLVARECEPSAVGCE